MQRAAQQSLGVHVLLPRLPRAHLVDTIDDWPGLSSAPALLRGERMIARHFDERGWIRAGRPEDRSPFEHEIALVHHRLPGYEHLDDAEYATVLRQLVDLREATARAERTRPLPDPDALLEADPDTIPVRMKMQPCPPCHSSCPERRAEFLEARGAIRDAYARASSRWRSGELTVSFPIGTYRPKLDWTGDTPPMPLAA